MQSVRILEMAARPLTEAIANAQRQLSALRVELLHVCPECHVPLDDFWCPSCETEPDDPPLTALDLPTNGTPLADILWTMEDDVREAQILAYMELACVDDDDESANTQAQQLIENIRARDDMLRQIVTTILLHTVAPGRTPERIALEAVASLTTFHEATISRAAAGKYAWILPEKRMVALSDLLRP